MSHVAEGRLAEYLDAELPAAESAEVARHLAACAECRALLEEARRKSDRAQAILRTAGTKGSARPSFADVVERAKTRSGRSADARRLSRITSLAWAATIVLAVAVGWFAHGFSLPSPGVSSVSEGGTIPAVEPAGSRMVAESSSAASPAPAASVVRQDRPIPRPLEARAAPPNPPVGTPAVAAAPAPVAPQRMDRAKTEEPDGAGRVAAEMKTLDAPSRNVVAGAPAADLGRQLPTVASGLRKRAVSGVWVDTTAAVASQVLGGRPLLIEGLPVSGYSVEVGGRPAVMVRQDLGGGAAITLIEYRTAAGLAGGRVDEIQMQVGGDVTVEKQGYSVTARGPVSRDSLAALLRSLH